MNKDFSPEFKPGQAGDARWQGLSDLADQFVEEPEERERIVAERIGTTMDNMAERELKFSKTLRGLAEKGQAMPANRLEFWERYLAEDWRQHETDLNKLGVRGKERTRLAAELEAPFIMAARGRGDDSVEVQSARLYRERRDALVEKIKESGSETAEKDLRTVGDLYGRAHEHIDFVVKHAGYGEMDRDEARQYWGERQRAHDAMIDQLNAVNDLARKYGTKPLTFRNFWASRYESAGGDFVEARCKADRDLVEAYVNVAFSDYYAKAHRRAGSMISQFHGGS